MRKNDHNEKLEKLEQDRVITYKAAFSSITGQSVIDDLKAYCGEYTTGFNNMNERQTSFNLGKRDVILYILRTINKELK